MIKDRKKDMPYTEGIRERIISAIEKKELEKLDYTNEVNAGMRIAKEAIINVIKDLEL